jgi:hypothetical protein
VWLGLGAIKRVRGQWLATRACMFHNMHMWHFVCKKGATGSHYIIMQSCSRAPTSWRHTSGGVPPRGLCCGQRLLNGWVAAPGELCTAVRPLIGVLVRIHIHANTRCNATFSACAKSALHVGLSHAMHAMQVHTHHSLACPPPNSIFPRVLNPLITRAP